MLFDALHSTDLYAYKQRQWIEEVEPRVVFLELTRHKNHCHETLHEMKQMKSRQRMDAQYRYGDVHSVVMKLLFLFLLLASTPPNEPKRSFSIKFYVSIVYFSLCRCAVLYFVILYALRVSSFVRRFCLENVLPPVDQSVHVPSSNTEYALCLFEH